MPDLTLRLPTKVEYPITSNFTMHLQRTPPSKAPGVDFAIPAGCQVLAAAPGRVTRCEWSDAGGRYLVIHHPELVEGAEGVYTFYCHLRAVWRVVGEAVDAGELVGLSGNTGRSTAPHLHFALKIAGEWVDPIPHLDT